MKNYILSLDSLYNEVCALADEHGAPNQDVWNDVVEEVVQIHKDGDEFALDQSADDFIEQLKEKFEEYQVDTRERMHVLDEEMADVGEDNNG